MLIVVAVGSYTTYGIMATKSSGEIDASLATVVISVVGVVLPLLYYATSVAIFDQSPVRTTSRGLVFSLLAGVAISAFSIAVINVFALGRPAFTFPVVYGSTIIVGAIAGWAVFDDRPSTLHVVGLLLTAAGVGTVAVANR
jgi:uncharacterized membrane protein